ncbi:hypothetical protein D3C75_793900 [compost metagenome]
MGLDAAHQPVADPGSGQGIGDRRLPQGAEAVFGQHKGARLQRLQLGHCGAELVRVLLQPDNRQPQRLGSLHQSGRVGDERVAPLHQAGQLALDIDHQQAGVAAFKHDFLLCLWRASRPRAQRCRALADKLHDAPSRARHARGVKVGQGLYVVAVRIAQEGGVVIGGIVGAQPRLPVADKAGPDASLMKLIHLRRAACREGEMAGGTLFAPLYQEAHLVVTNTAETCASLSAHLSAIKRGASTVA